MPTKPRGFPAYVDRGGEAVWRHPSRLWRARIYGFGVPVSEERQRECLDRCINRVANDSNTRYGPGPSENKFELRVVPGLGTVMLMFVDYERITSGNDDDALLGGTRYREFLVMQLAPSSTQDPPELNWFIPFIYLDTDSPRLAGREILAIRSSSERSPHSYVTQMEARSSTRSRRCSYPLLWSRGPRSRMPTKGWSSASMAGTIVHRRSCDTMPTPQP